MLSAIERNRIYDLETSGREVVGNSRGGVKGPRRLQGCPILVAGDGRTVFQGADEQGCGAATRGSRR